MILDPKRRWFTASEVTAAWLRQDRRCIDCRRAMPRDLIEGDHIVAWSKGGPTSMDNLHGLCVACNRRKGNREVQVYRPPEIRDVHGGDGRLREWQVKALKLIQETTGPVLIEACPGAGKTRFALEVAYRMFQSGDVNRLLIAAPTVRIVQQWVQEAEGLRGAPKLPLAPASWRPTDPIYETLCGAAFTWATLCSNTTQMEALAAEPGYRTLVILDEVHTLESVIPSGSPLNKLSMLLRFESYHLQAQPSVRTIR
jgi:superfamily II DNA or RNA helicase